MRARFLRRGLTDWQFTALIVLLFFAVAIIATAGEAEDKASAAFAVARAALEVADEQPDFPKKNRASGSELPVASATVGGLIPEDAESDESPIVITEPAKLFAVDHYDTAVIVRVDSGRVHYWGSGVIVRSVDDTAEVLTVAHLTRGVADPMVSVFVHGRRHYATLIKQDEKADLALYAIDVKALPAELASELPAIGDQVESIGRQGQQVTIPTGISRVNSRVVGIDRTGNLDHIVTDEVIYEGRSGSGLFDAGRLVGIAKGVIIGKPQSLYVGLPTIQRFLNGPATATMEPVSERLRATVYTNERSEGVGWCRYCDRLKSQWGSGNGEVELIWSQEAAPGIPGQTVVYPAIRFEANGKTMYPSTASGRYLQPPSLESLAETIRFARGN